MSRFLLHSCVIPNLSAVLFRKECFRAVGNLSSEYRVCCDWDLFFRIAPHFDVAYVAEPLNKFRQHQATIRSSVRDRVVYEEYFRLLLGKIKTLKLSNGERAHFRMHVMCLWSVHFTSVSWGGLCNFPHHFSRIAVLDPIALLFLLPALIWRAGDLARKIILKIFRMKRASPQAPHSSTEPFSYKG